MHQQEFRFTIHNPRKKTHNLFAIFLLLIHLAFLTILFMKGFTKIVANNTYFILLIIVIDTMLALLYTKAKRNIEYTFTVTGLHVNDFPTKKWDWSLFNNVIIKDGLLTIDFKNNKIQQILLPANYWEFEQKFNEFCKEQLNNQFN